MMKKFGSDVIFNVISGSDENEKSVVLTIIKWAFKVICMVSTFILIARGIERYLENDDVTKIQTPTYKDDGIDIFPAISLCFEQKFDDSTFEKFGLNITGENYKKFLIGDYFDKRMLDIKYEDVTLNISDFMLAYHVTFKNGSAFKNDFDKVRPDMGWKAPYSSFSWVNWGFFVKCFTLKVTDVNVTLLTWDFDRSIFPNGIRPRYSFSVLFHYPNQILDSLNTITRQWSPKTENENYWMDFNVLGMDVFHRRYIPNEDNCIQDWKNYDNLMVEKHISAIGCKAPYQKTIRDWPVCDSQDKMKKTLLPIKTGYIPPCRTIEMIDYQFEPETDAATFGMTDLEVGGKNWTQWFSITYMFISDKFTVSINKKKMDFESLVGYIGGYVGLFAGFAVAEIPGMLNNGMAGIKWLYLLLVRHDARIS